MKKLSALQRKNLLALFNGSGNPFDGKKVGAQKILPAMSTMFRLNGPMVQPQPSTNFATSMGKAAGRLLRSVQ